MSMLSPDAPVGGRLAAAIAKAAGQTALQLGEDDKSLVELVRTRLGEADRAQRDQDRIWRENIAYVEGLQWLQALSTGTVYNNAGRIRRNRIRITDNRTIDHARRLHARFSQVTYAPSVTADESDDPGDKKAARALHAGLRWFHRRRRVETEKRKADWWLVVCGTCYLEPYFDPELGPYKLLPVLDPATGQPVMEPELDDAGEQAFDETVAPDGTSTRTPRTRPKMELQPIGNVDFVVRAPFAVRRDPRFQDWRQLRWVAVREPAAREAVIDRYADAYKTATGRDLEADLPQDSSVYNPLPWMPEPAPDTKDYTGLPRPSRATGIVPLVRYYERASRKHPRGRHTVLVEGTDLVLHKGDLDTPDGDIPLTPLINLERPWVLEGKAPITDIKPLQRLYNRIISRYGEHMIRLSTGWLLIPTNSGIPRNAFTNEIGAVIRHTPGSGKPDFVFPPFGEGLAWYDRFLDRLVSSMEERAMLPPAVRGVMPQGARAARTVQLLQEAADQGQTPVLAGIRDGWREFWVKVGGLMDRHFTIPRMVAMQGPSRVAEIYEFKKGLLPRDWRDRLTVDAEMGESLPLSRLARWEMILTLAKEHSFFGDPKTDPAGYVRRLKEALDLDAGFVSTPEDLDITIAEEENLTMLHTGQSLPVRKIDDDRVHGIEHITFIKRLIASGREDEALPHMQHFQLHVAQDRGKSTGATPDVGAEPQEPEVPGGPPGPGAPPAGAPIQRLPVPAELRAGGAPIEAAAGAEAGPPAPPGAPPEIPSAGPGA